MDQSCLVKRQRGKTTTKTKTTKTSIKRNTSVDSSQYKRPTGTCSPVVRKMAYLPVRIANSGNSAADTIMVLVLILRILPDRLKLIRQYPCGSLGPNISFSFGALAGHFAATPQGDVMRIYMCTWFWRHGDAFGTTEKSFFRAFITIRSQFHLYHRSPRALTEIVSKITPNLRLVLYVTPEGNFGGTPLFLLQSCFLAMTHILKRRK